MLNRKQRLSSLIETLSPKFFEIIDESKFHHVPKDGETHFKLRIVSKEFDSLSKISRHKLIYKLVDSEFKSGLHALQLELFSPNEWQNQEPLKNPPCRSGYDKEQGKNQEES